MKCSDCYHLNPAGTAFCIRCGSPLSGEGEGDEFPKLSEVAALLTEPNAFIHMGTHFDGSPLVLEVVREHREFSEFRELCGGSAKTFLELETKHDLLDESEYNDFQRAIAEVARIGRSIICKEDLIIEDGGAFAYLSPTPIGDLLGTTLLERFLGSGSPIDPVSSRDWGVERPSGLRRATGLEESIDTEAAERGRYHVDSTRCLSISLQDGSVNVLNQAPDGTTLYDKRPYISECITCFSDSELPPYYIRVVDGEAQHMAIEMESAGFRGKTTQIKPFPDTFNPHTYLGWGISRKSVALGLIALAREIDDLHGQGLVHGDLRPANILSGKNGLVAIDHLNIECGQPSGAVAPGWAAPEQLLGQAVGPQSDVFSLGIIAAQLCGAVVFGEMRNFVFPVGGKERKTVSLFHHPRVFIDSNEKFSVESCKAWSGFIESCLQFDPADRIQSADAFAVKMQETLDTYGLPLTLEMSSLGPGRHQKCRTTNGATTSVCYILSQMHIIPFSPRRLT